MTTLTRGCADLDSLWAELALWPGYKVAEIHPGCVWSGGPDHRAGVTHSERMTDSWCVVVEQDGYAPSDRWLEWGASIADAAAKLADTLRRHREYPHLAHIEAHTFLASCRDCADEVADNPEWADLLEGDGPVTSNEAQSMELFA